MNLLYERAVKCHKRATLLLHQALGCYRRYFLGDPGMSVPQLLYLEMQMHGNIKQHVEHKNGHPVKNRTSLCGSDGKSLTP